jgi:hypothetical protein
LELVAYVSNLTHLVCLLLLVWAQSAIPLTLATEPTAPVEVEITVTMSDGTEAVVVVPGNTGVPGSSGTFTLDPTNWNLPTDFLITANATKSNFSAPDPTATVTIKMISTDEMYDGMEIEFTTDVRANFAPGTITTVTSSPASQPTVVSARP